MNPAMKRVIDDVAKYGWHVVAVRAEDGSGPAYSFSVGFFETYDHPELVIFGLPKDAAHQVIGACLERIQEGAVFEAGQVRDDILKSHSIAVLGVEQAFYEEYLGTAIGFYGNPDFPALQLVWPDKGNHFPWEPEYDPTYRGSQTILNTGAS